MAITDTACRQAKAAEKPYKLAAGDGLYQRAKNYLNRRLIVGRGLGKEPDGRSGRIGS